MSLITLRTETRELQVDDSDILRIEGRVVTLRRSGAQIVLAEGQAAQGLQTQLRIARNDRRAESRR